MFYVKGFDRLPLDITYKIHEIDLESINIPGVGRIVKSPAPIAVRFNGISAGGKQQI
jgi:hypothetical protein